MSVLCNDDIETRYESYPLVQSMLQQERKRTNSMKEQGKNQINYPKSTDGWIPSIFIIRGRSLDWMIYPWMLVVGHATLYTILQQIYFSDTYNLRETNSWEIFFSLSLNSTLAFLLVFRLNRTVIRFWSARKLWGDIVARSRTFVGEIIVHGDHDRFHRDEAIRWVTAFPIATMDLLRDEKVICHDNYAGILSKEQIDILVQQTHQPVFAVDQARFHLKFLFRVDATTPTGLAISKTQEFHSLEAQLSSIAWCCSGMELIKGTPLPIVYVSHLRTFLILNLIIFPYIFGPSWGWMTIPIVAASGFAWLGIESSAMEVERPFFKTRVNSLNMNAYILALLTTIQQHIKNHADYEINTERAKSVVTIADCIGKQFSI